MFWSSLWLSELWMLLESGPDDEELELDPAGGAEAARVPAGEGVVSAVLVVVAEWVAEACLADARGLFATCDEKGSAGETWEAAGEAA
jgi:hypothetical protein